MSSNNHLCPSAPLNTGAKLLGIVNSENEIDILTSPIDVSQDFIDAASKGRPVEERFRFVNKCVKNGCQNWENNSCNVIKVVLDNMENKYWADNLPECSIRNDCRWFNQEGANACKVCTLIKYHD